MDAKHGACGWLYSLYDTAPREVLRHHPTAVGELVRPGRLVGHQLLPEGRISRHAALAFHTVAGHNLVSPH